ncbi:MAG: hypothetical protein PHR15_08295 [Atopobiaceae bacterium]|nr:hypothetical protein [Atopobiaceae bacterium]MCH4181036.1 hypothetical protein [Atopobiaceae bacterium]MCH4213759.1 hypothetical protein [Atopobiaceae bacterium]MCH4230546.1 hypothetical protein [Atopobiaceae bacterium]MCI1226985.1 hypothetical protein [Atopobiaceae bacterium]
MTRLHATIRRLALRLAHTSGESIVETLVGILVVTLSVTLLLTATTSAITIDRQAKQAATARSDERAAAESLSGTGTTGTVRLGSDDHSATFYGGSDVVGYEAN